MVENMTCLLGMLTNDQTNLNRHGAQLDCPQGPGEYFGLMEIFLE
jgi:hypothetical protein